MSKIPPPPSKRTKFSFGPEDAKNNPREYALARGEYAGGPVDHEYRTREARVAFRTDRYGK